MVVKILDDDENIHESKRVFSLSINREKSENTVLTVNVMYIIMGRTIGKLLFTQYLS